MSQESERANCSTAGRRTRTPKDSRRQTRERVRDRRVYTRAEKTNPHASHSRARTPGRGVFNRMQKWISSRDTRTRTLRPPLHRTRTAKSRRRARHVHVHKAKTARTQRAERRVPAAFLPRSLASNKKRDAHVVTPRGSRHKRRSSLARHTSGALSLIETQNKRADSRALYMQRSPSAAIQFQVRAVDEHGRNKFGSN